MHAIISFNLDMSFKTKSFYGSCFRVDRESVAEQAGLQVGDLILNVNGTSFESIPHQEAVDFVKSQQHIIMTVKVCIDIKVHQMWEIISDLLAYLYL